MAKSHTTVRLDEEVRRQIDDYCARTLQKRSDVLRKIIMKYVKANPRDFKYGNNPN